MMPSTALVRWTSSRALALDELESAHRAVGGSGPGRRFATQQINFAYAVLVSAQFQGFCRDLHTEAVGYIVQIAPAHFQAALADEFAGNRRIDRGNPNPGNLGTDFNRLGIVFWDKVVAHHTRNSERRSALEELNRWRNAIAHQDFSGVTVAGGRTTLHLADVQAWRKVCDGLAKSFDEILRVYILRITSSTPW
jgi:hypothetical protein